ARGEGAARRSLSRGRAVIRWPPAHALRGQAPLSAARQPLRSPRSPATHGAAPRIVPRGELPNPDRRPAPPRGSPLLRRTRRVLLAQAGGRSRGPGPRRARPRRPLARARLPAPDLHLFRPERGGLAGPARALSPRSLRGHPRGPPAQAARALLPPRG